MKIVIDRAALLKPLGHVQSVVERRNTIPILSNVLLKAADGRLSLSTTDMDMDIVETVACDVGVEGVVTVHAHMLYEIVRKLPEGADVELAATADGGKVSIRAGRSAFSLPALSPEEFPVIGGDTLPHGFLVGAADVRMLIDRTRFAISTEETRYYLNGIYLHAAEDNGVKVLRAVATDGHRLARVQMPLPGGAEEMPGVIVPRKAVSEIHKLISETGGEIAVSLSGTRLRVAFGDTVVTTKLIDGTFPDYERVIPTGNDKVLHVDRQRFSGAVDRVATISTEKSRSVKLAVSDGTLVLSASSPDNGTAQEEVEVNYTADALEIGFNSKYLLDITGQIEGEQAVFQFADQASPTIILDREDESALYVLMPMRV